MPSFKADMDDNYQKVIKVANIKRVFQRDNGDWAFETNGGEFGTASKKGYKRLVRHRPEIIEQPAPHNALLAWLETRPDDDDDTADEDDE